MTTEFKVGDIVEAFGCRGEVVSIDSDGSLVVDFSGNKLAFYSSGKYLVWHKEPSLKLIERKKEKKLVEHWMAIIKYEDGAGIPIGLYSNEEQAIKDHVGFLRLAKELPAILLEVEE